MSGKVTVLGVIAAMDEEVAELHRLASAWEAVDIRGVTFHRGRGVGENSEVSLIIVKCGVGKVLSAMVAERLIANFSPNFVVVTGIAGALNSDYEIGDVVVSQDTLQHDLDASALGFSRGTVPYTKIRELHGSPKLLRLVQQSGAMEAATGHRVHIGRILSGDQFITHRELESHQYLTTELCGDAIEMEGASVATVCHLNRVPFIIIRSISDRADGTATIDFGRFAHVAAANSRQILERLIGQILKSANLTEA